MLPLRLDDVDRKIIARLVENGRESFAALGIRVGLSTAATKRDEAAAKAARFRKAVKQPQAVSA